MSRLLIVNADDFGLCEAITGGIVKAYKDGIVTSVSVAANGGYFKEGLPFLRDSGVDAGVHLTLTGSERPLTGSVPGLVGKNGLFLNSYRDVVPRVLLGRFDPDALKEELSAQIESLTGNRVPVSHLDSHQHLHLLPAVRRIVVELAERFHIPWIRVPEAGASGVTGLALNVLGGGLRKTLRRHGIRCTDAFSGFDNGGHIDGAALPGLLERLRDNTVTELMVHPGYDASAAYDWGYAWEAELAALTSGGIKALIKEKGIQLMKFREMR